MNCQSVSAISFVAEMASKKLLETKESYIKIILSVKVLSGKILSVSYTFQPTCSLIEVV